MRLFSKIDGAINRFDRPMWLGLLFSGWLSSGAITDAWTVPQENRIYVVEAADRIYTVPEESRVYTV